MLKAKAIYNCEKYRIYLRNAVEEIENDMASSIGMAQTFTGHRGHDAEAAIGSRNAWAVLLVELWLLETDLESTSDEWWNGPKMKDEPFVGDPSRYDAPRKDRGQGLGYMLACMRDGEHAVHKNQEDKHQLWKDQRRNKHWTRAKEAQAQIKHPKRRFKISSKE